MIPLTTSLLVGTPRIGGPNRSDRELAPGLHKAGIGVILDVVYNHTAIPTPLDIVPYYYYRRNLMAALQRFWVRYYHNFERSMFRKTDDRLRYLLGRRVPC